MPPEFLEIVASHFDTMLRFAARIFHFAGVDIVIIYVYLWCSEGFSDRNEAILYQIQMLITLLKLPFLIVGDLNIPIAGFAESGWVERLGAELLHPGFLNPQPQQERTL